MRLSEKQRQALEALSHGERSAYPGLHIGVLNSLSLKKLATAKHELGSMFSPRTSIKWSITDAGRKALAESL